MSAANFPPYAISYSASARKTRLVLSPSNRQLADEIEAELANDPDCHPERLIPASVNGNSCIYRHPAPDLQITFEIDRDKQILYIFHYFAPALAPQQTVFVSYSHQDQPWLDKLRVFLTVLEQQGLIKFWDDSQLVPGLPWETQIKEVLATVKAGLLLVSQQFLASKFVKDVELPKLLDLATKQGKKIYWLHLSPSTVFDTHRQIAQYQSLLTDPMTSLAELDAVTQQKALVEVTKKLMDFAKAN